MASLSARHQRHVSLYKSKKRNNNNIDGNNNCRPSINRPDPIKTPSPGDFDSQPSHKINKDLQFEHAGDGCLLKNSFDKGQSPWTIGSRTGGPKTSKSGGSNNFIRKKTGGANHK